MTPTPDYYEILQVSPKADSEVIQAAYRRLAQKHHPDAGATSDVMMRLLNDAYQVLSDPDRRRDYDTKVANTQANTNHTKPSNAPPTKEQPQSPQGNTSKLIFFDCNKCGQTLKLLKPSRPGMIRCPKCNNRSDYPPRHPTAHQIKLDMKVINQLRRLHETTWPGHKLFSWALPTLLVLFVPMLCFPCICAMPFAPGLNAKNGNAKNPTDVKKASTPPPVVQPLAITAYFVSGFFLVVWILLLVSLFLRRNKLNNDYLRANGIRLIYSELNVAPNYSEIYRIMGAMASTRIIEVAPAGSNRLKIRSYVSLKYNLPKFMSCNLKVFCLAAGKVKYFFFPDVVLFSDGRRFVAFE